MKRLNIIIKGIIVTFFIISNNPSNLNGQIVDNKIVAGTIDSIYSKVLNEKRKMWVYVPDSNSLSLYRIKEYPVIYLLDGDEHFLSVTGMIKQLSQLGRCPEMIVVGILNTDRVRDLTPTHVNTKSAEDINSGGGENFTKFIYKELIYHIDSLYPTAPYRMLIGHSFGGLMVANTLLNHSQLFNSYVAIDPSMWWDNERLLKEFAATLPKEKYERKSLYLAMANSMNPNIDTMVVRTDTSESTNSPRSILHFVDILKSNHQNGLNWCWKYYQDYDHGTIPLIAEYDALQFIFKSYKLPSSLFDKVIEKYFDSGTIDIYYNSDSTIIAHYKNLSNELGYEFLPPKVLLSITGYIYQQKKIFDKSYIFRKMNVDYYPKSADVYTDMGELYYAKGDKQKAIEYYLKALTIEESTIIREKLQKLKSEN